MTGHLYYWVADWNLTHSQAALLLGGPSAEMIDCTHDNAAKVIPEQSARGVHRFAGYITGTPDIRWTAEDWARVPGNDAIWKIDQSNADLPVLSDVRVAVKDDEPGASSNATAVEVAKQRLAHGDDYIIYTDRANLSALENAVRAAGLPPGRIIAFQIAGNVERAYDVSVVLTAYMPLPGAPKPKPAPDPVMRAIVRAPIGAGGTTATVTFDPDSKSWDIHTRSDVHGWQVAPTSAAETP